MFRFPAIAIFAAAGLLRGETSKVTFDQHVLPVFEQSCLNCHNPDKAKGGLDLSTYQGTLKGGSGGKIVEPGDSSSKLLAVVMRTAEPTMPPEGDAISKDHIDTLSAWIEGGLLQNADSKAKKPSKPKFDTAMSADPQARPEGPPPMPRDLRLDPPTLAERPSAIHALAASPWAPLLAVTGQRQILLYDTDRFELAGILPFPEGDPVSLAFTPNGRYLIVGGGLPGKSGLTVSFDVTTGERALTAAKEFDTVLAADLRPDLGAVATGSPSRLVKLWKSDDGSRTAAIKKHTDWVTALDYSPDGILLATGDRNGGVWVWEALSGAEFHTLRAHQAGITAASFRGDSNLLATASEDGSVRFWEMNNGKEVRKLDAHPGGVTAFAWAPDGSFATAGRDRKAKLWKADFGQQQVIDKLPDLPTAIAVAGERVFIADYTGHIFVHRREKGERIGQLDNNPPSIETRLARLGETLAAFPERIRAATTARDESAAKVGTLEQQLAETRAGIPRSREAIETARQAESRANGEATRLQHETETLDAAHQAAKAERNRLAGERTKQQEQLTGIRQRLAEARAAEQAIDALQAEEKTTQEALAALDPQLEAARKQAADTLAALQEARKKANASRQLAAAEKQKREQAAQQLSGLEKQLPEQEKQLAEARKQLDEHRQAAAAALREEAEAMQTQRRWVRAGTHSRALDTRQQAAAARSEAETVAAEFGSIAREIEEHHQQMAAKRAKLVKLVEGDAPEEERDAAIRALDEEIAGISQSLEALTSRLDETRAELDRRLPAAAALEREAAELLDRFHAASGTGG